MSARGRWCRWHLNRTLTAGIAGLPGAAIRPDGPGRPSPAARVAGREPATRTLTSLPGWSARTTGLRRTTGVVAGAQQTTWAALPMIGGLRPTALAARPDQPICAPMMAAVGFRLRQTGAGPAPMRRPTTATTATGQEVGVSLAGTGFRRDPGSVARRGCRLRRRRVRGLRSQRRDEIIPQRGPRPVTRTRRRPPRAGRGGATNLTRDRMLDPGRHRGTEHPGPAPLSGPPGPAPASGWSGRCLRQPGGHSLRSDPGWSSRSCAPCRRRQVQCQHGRSQNGLSQDGLSQHHRPKSRRRSPLLAAGPNSGRIFRWRISNGCGRH